MNVPPARFDRRFGERRVRRHLVRIVDRAVAADPVRLGHAADSRIGGNDRSLHPTRDRGHLDRRGALWRHARRGGRGCRGTRRPDGGGSRRDPRGDLHGRRDQRAREDPRPRHGGVRRRAGRVRRARGALDPLRADVLGRRRHRARASAQARGRGARSRGPDWPGSSPRRPASTPERCASGAPTGSTPSRPRSV